MFDVKPLLRWFDALDRRIRLLEAEVSALQGERLMREVDQVMADCRAEGGNGKAKSKPSRTVGMSNIPRKPRGRSARA